MFLHLCGVCKRLEIRVRKLDHHLSRLERLMATATEQLNTLSTKVDDLVSDVRSALAVIGAEDELSTEAQAALDTINAKVDAFDAEVGDADGSDTPPVPA